uniref:Magnesium-dependent phosphatase 1 n=1 Tax=Geotrypetes seraphini TaxID=260995 RepID=A0A6P8PW19_GEOSA|nr:magnesium-dependent phosphatase 1-like isoform X1 [Geotrypetes seraphini]
MSRKLELVVFDLDYTLWPFWVDTHVDPPFLKTSDGRIVDQTGRSIRLYNDVPQVLEELHKQGILMAAASRTGEVKGANQLLQLFSLDHYFSQKEIYPGCKVNHFQRIQQRNGIPYQNMMFFDDERQNITDVRPLGVTCVLVQNGMSLKILKEALEKFPQ